MGSHFLILPFLLNYLDADTLGLWYVFLSVGALVSLFDFGFSPTFARNIAYSWSGAKKLNRNDVDFAEKSEPNIMLLKKVIRTCKVIYFIISLLALILLLTFGTYYLSLISANFIGSHHYLAWVIYCIAVFFNLLFGYFIAILRGVGAIAELNKATILSRLVQILVSIFLLYLQFGILAVSIAYLASGMIFRLLSAIAFNNYHSAGLLLKEDNNNISINQVIDTLRIIWPNTWRDGLVSLSNYISNKSTVIICSLFLSLAETGVYSISLQFVTAAATISGSLYSAYQPALQEAHVYNDTDSSKKLMATAMVVYQITYILGIIAIIFVGIPILTIFKNDMVFDIPVFIGMSIYMFLLKQHSYYASYISNTNNIPYLKSFVISSILGIFITVILIQTAELGVWSLILGPGFAQLIYNNWVWPLTVRRSLNSNSFDFFITGLKGAKDIILFK